MECPKCKAKVGIMRHLLMVDTGAVHCVKCYICGFWVQAERGQNRQNLSGV
jgi:Zn ribbon nucleic-acid-binding protein